MLVLDLITPLVRLVQVARVQAPVRQEPAAVLQAIAIKSKMVDGRNNPNLLGLREDAYLRFLSDYADTMTTKPSIDIDGLVALIQTLTQNLDFSTASLQTYSDIIMSSIVDFVSNQINYPNIEFLQKETIREIFSKDYQDKLQNIIAHCWNFVSSVANEGGNINIQSLNTILLSSYKTHFENLIAFFCNRVSYLYDARSNISTQFSKIEDKIIYDFLPSGDYHNGGQAVFSFNVRGEEYFYKPRSSETDKYLADSLKWLSDRTCSKPVLIPSSTSGKNYSYQRSVKTDAENYKDVVGKNAAYRNHCASQLGEMIYICWLLGISDLNSENYDLVREGVVLFDTEAISVSRLSSDVYNNEYMVNKFYATNDAFLTQLVLPAKQKFQKGVFDFSMLSDILNDAGTLDPNNKRQFLNIMIDSLRSAQDRIIFQKGEFKNFLRCFLQSYDPEFRIVPRPTCDYGYLIEALSNPLVAGDDEQRKVVFSALLNSIKEQPWNEPFIREEISSLLQFEVPFFYRKATDNNLYSRGKVISGNYFSSTPAEETVSRLDRLEIIAQAQIRMVEISTILDGVPFDTKSYWPALIKYNPETPIAAAVEIGQFLKKGVMEYTNDVLFWPSPQPLEDKGFTPSLTGADIYSGYAGLAIFYAALAKTTGDAGFIAFAHKMYAGLQHFIKGNVTKNPGFLDGQAGLLTASFIVSDLLEMQEPDYSTYLIDITEEILKINSYDFSQGSAGILYVLAMSNMAESKKNVLIRKLADHLLKGQMDNSPGFINPSFDNKELGGFAHGNAGIAYALYLAFRLTGDERYKNKAVGAFEDELDRFQNGEYKDGRTVEGSVIPLSWCFGTSGVSIAANLSESILPQDVLERIRIVNKQMVKQYIHDEHDWCVCHGFCGIVESDILEGKTVKWPSLLSVIADKDGKILENKDFWLLTPGLFTGLAGLGYHLLRSVVPEEIPSLFACRSIFKHAYVSQAA